jgi:hypothetical protein
MSDDARDGDELLAQIAGGDMGALEALYRRMRVQVFAVARLRPLVQEEAS